MNNLGKMNVIGITGGIGSGKSTAAKIINEKGFPVISADDKAKELMVNDENIRKNIIAVFGKEAYDENGNPDTQFLSNLVFGSSESNVKALSKLNSIVHPPMIDYLISEVERREDKGDKILFVESALIFEAGLEEGFNYIIVIDTPENIAIQRIIQRGKLSEKDIRLRMESQMSPEKKKKLADFAIDNKGTFEELRKSIEFILGIIVE